MASAAICAQVTPPRPGAARLRGARQPGTAGPQRPAHMPNAAKPRPGAANIPARAAAKAKSREARNLSLADIAIAKAQAAHAETQAWEAALVLCEKESRIEAAKKEGRAVDPAPSGGEAASPKREHAGPHEQGGRTSTTRGRSSRGTSREGVARAAERAGRRGAGTKSSNPAAGVPSAASPPPREAKGPRPSEGGSRTAKRSRAEEEARLRASIHFPARFPAREGAPRGTYRGQGATSGPSGSRVPTDGGRSPLAVPSSSSSYSSSSESPSTLSSSSTDSEEEADGKCHQRRAEPGPAAERPSPRPKSGCEAAGRRRCRRRLPKVRRGKTRRGGAGARRQRERGPSTTGSRRPAANDHSGGSCRRSPAASRGQPADREGGAQWHPAGGVGD